ncbi:AAA family ATPase [Caenispirillum bisanense]|uniref:AAA family ATPase n=1 Tax=Caenispirillum bisanense TaxID=414052 RepID=UPI0031DBD036
MVKTVLVALVVITTAALGVRLWSLVVPALPYVAGAGVVVMGLSAARSRGQLQNRRIQLAQQRERERLSKAPPPPPPPSRDGPQEPEGDDVVLRPVQPTRDGPRDGGALQESLRQLEALTGLDGVKRQINDLVSLAVIQQERRKRGLDQDSARSFHMVFTGNPGTGKTTVARLVGNILRDLGFLAKGHVVEVDRGNLVAGYIGQTAIQTKKKIQEAMGGVLFIDEAYSLAKGGGNDFGSEAIDTLLKAMEDHRDAFVVIVAGYREEMKTFINANPGLKSRFDITVHFEDYAVDDLTTIFGNFARQQGYQLAPGTSEAAAAAFSAMIAASDGAFGNGREARRLWERTVQNHARRLHGKSRRNDAALVTVLPEDVPATLDGGA